MSYVVAHTRRVGTAVGVANVAAHNSREGIYDSLGKPLGKLPDWITHPERARLNSGDRCSGSTVLKRRSARIAEANLARKPQRNASAAIEIVVSASPDWFDPKTPGRWASYLSDALEFIGQTYGKENILHHAVHCDERTPHLHVLLVPLTRKMESRERDRTTGKDTRPRKIVETQVLRYGSNAFLGGRRGLRKLQDDLATQVGAKYGLERGVRGSTARHTDQYEWAAKVARQADTLAMERGGLDLRGRELDKREREVERKEAALEKRIQANGVILQNTLEERKAITALLAAYPDRKLLELVKDRLHGLTDQADINAAWKAMGDTAEAIQKAKASARIRPQSRGRDR